MCVGLGVFQISWHACNDRLRRDSGYTDWRKIFRMVLIRGFNSLSLCHSLFLFLSLCQYTGYIVWGDIEKAFQVVNTIKYSLLSASFDHFPYLYWSFGPSLCVGVCFRSLTYIDSMTRKAVQTLDMSVVWSWVAVQFSLSLSSVSGYASLCWDQLTAEERVLG